MTSTIKIIDEITFKTESGGINYYLGQYLADMDGLVNRIFKDNDSRWCLELIERNLDVFVVYVDAEGKFIEDDE